MKFYMIGLYTWISLVYYYIYCEERSYNGVMAMFWGVMAIIWIWDAITGYTTFERTHKYDLLSYVLLAMPFIYPLVSLARGLSFPEMTSPVMPCSVVVFTIGLLLLFAQKVNMFLVLFLCHWSLIGGKALLFCIQFSDPIVFQQFQAHHDSRYRCLQFMRDR